MKTLPWIVVLGVVAGLAGCNQPAGPQTASPEGLTVATWAERAERRAYDGAPPVIPHPPLSGRCVECHTAEGSVRPPIGVAPANPHLKTPGMSDASRCRQCHVFKVTDDRFAVNDFQPLRRSSPYGERAHALAPPTIPHPLWMHEDCAACHAGPAARPEIRCTHPERLRCRQCHAASQPPEALAGATFEPIELKVN